MTTLPINLLKKIGQNEVNDKNPWELPKDTLWLEIVDKENRNCFYPRTFLLEDWRIIRAC